MKFEVKELSCTFKNNKGIKDISFTVNEGDVLAIIGPNGAGKTTLIKSIIGLSKKNKGCVLLDGKHVEKNDISFMLSEDILIERFSVMQMINYIMEMKSIDYVNIESLLFKYNLHDYADERIKNLSQGTRKRIAILIAIIANPKVIIFDEPTNGLDIDGVIMLKEIIEQKKKEKKIVIITSHILDFIDNVANKTIFIKDGTIIGECENGLNKLENEYKRIVGE